MSLQFKLFEMMPGDTEGEESLNRFLRGHRVLKVDREFLAGVWHFCVQWESGESEADRRAARGKPRIDYKEVLEPSVFALFSRLREVRKELAARERMPAFAVMTNEQLAEVAQMPCQSLSDL